MKTLEITVKHNVTPGADYISAIVEAKNQAFEYAKTTDADYLVLVYNDLHKEVIAKNYHGDKRPATGKAAEWTFVEGFSIDEIKGQIIEVAFTYSVI